MNKNAWLSVKSITLASNWHLLCFIVEQTDERIFGKAKNNNSKIYKQEKEGGDRRQTECVRNPGTTNVNETHKRKKSDKGEKQ